MIRYKWYAHTEGYANYTTVRRYGVDEWGKPLITDLSAMVLRFPGAHSMTAARFARALNELELKEKLKNDMMKGEQQ